MVQWLLPEFGLARWLDPEQKFHKFATTLYLAKYNRGKEARGLLGQGQAHSVNQVVSLYVCPCVYLSVWLYMCLSICLSVCLSVFLSVCLCQTLLVRLSDSQ